jgi:predicted 3-demethylubiquinone-9 3-methyltransferase (glyoxalase superfamily)
MEQTRRISPSLWFDGNAEDAMAFYRDVFADFRLVREWRWTKAGPGPEGGLISAAFEVLGLQFVAINGGPHYQFTPATSFTIHCRTQAEVDHYWDALLAGGEAMACGWLTDRFGVTWQIVPDALLDFLADADAERVGRVTEVMMGMEKLEIEPLRRAFAGE